jgi:hypothetical protein
MRAKNKLDWDPMSEAGIPHSWERGLLIYCIYLWSNGDGSKITDPEAYPLRRLFGTYKSKRKSFLQNRSQASGVFPSPLELVRMAQQSQDVEGRMAAQDVLIHVNISNAALARLQLAYISYRARVPVFM